MVKHDTEKSVFWYTAKDPSPGTALAGTVNADVAVVGGGMAGLSCAQTLREGGLSVVLLEKNFCGAGASGKTSGFITPDSEIELSSLISRFGPEQAKRVWELVLSGVAAIRTNIERHDIACDYAVQDSFFVANGQIGMRHVLAEHKARQALGYMSRLYEKSDIRKTIGSTHYMGAVRYPGTFGINSYLYCQSLRDIVVNAGVTLYEKTPAVRIHAHGIDTPDGRVHAKHIIVCLDRFIPDISTLRKEIYHVQTFLGISKPLKDSIIHRIFPDERMMVWDTNLVYNYFRATGQGRILLGGGDLLYTYARALSHNTTRFKRRLTAYFNNKCPDIPIELEYVWPGMLGVSKDLLPIMGPDTTLENVWYVGAATGLPWAAALGIYAADRIIMGRNEFDEMFSWRRKFIINPRIQTLLSTPVTYAVSHGIAKYF